MSIDPGKLNDAAYSAARSAAKAFDKQSGIKNKERSSMVALLDPEEIVVKLDDSSSTNSSIYHALIRTSQLQDISLLYQRREEMGPAFDDKEDETRERFADRCMDEAKFMIIKRLNKKLILSRSISRREISSLAASMTQECRFLSNLQRHPHIAQLYGIHANGYRAPFVADTDDDDLEDDNGGFYLSNSFFIITDSIVETLEQRFETWRKKLGYAKDSAFLTHGDTPAELAPRIQQISQRLEVALDVASALQFLSKNKVVYNLHPSKVGFDSKHQRIKLFDFGNAFEANIPAYHNSFRVTKKFEYQIYAAPEFLLQAIPLASSAEAKISEAPSTHRTQEVIIDCQADVFSFGMLLLQTLTLQPPFGGISKDDHYEQVVKGKTRPDVNPTWPNSVKRLLNACWLARPEARPPMPVVFTKLEDCLMNFEEEGKGIDRTENHDSGQRSKPIRQKSSSRKIHYRGKSDTHQENPGDTDGRSIKSRESLKSRQSHQSRDSRRSRDSSKSRGSHESIDRLKRTTSSSGPRLESSSQRSSQDASDDKGGPTSERSVNRVSRLNSSKETSSRRVHDEGKSSKPESGRGSRQSERTASRPEADRSSRTLEPTAKAKVQSSRSSRESSQRNMDHNERSEGSHRSKDRSVDGISRSSSPNDRQATTKLSESRSRRRHSSDRITGVSRSSSSKDSPKPSDDEGDVVANSKENGTTKGKSRKIKYERAKPYGHDDRDAKSVRSRQSARSRESVRSTRSRDSVRSKESHTSRGSKESLGTAGERKRGVRRIPSTGGNSHDGNSNGVDFTRKPPVRHKSELIDRRVAMSRLMQSPSSKPHIHESPTNRRVRPGTVSPVRGVRRAKSTTEKVYMLPEPSVSALARGKSRRSLIRRSSADADLLADSVQAFSESNTNWDASSPRGGGTSLGGFDGEADLFGFDNLAGEDPFQSRGKSLIKPSLKDTPHASFRVPKKV